MLKTILSGVRTVPRTLALLAATTTIANADTFEDKVVQVILNRPEVVLAALKILEERQAVQDADEKRHMIALAHDQLFSADAPGAIADRESLLVEFFDYNCGYCVGAAKQVSEFAANAGNRINLVELPILGQHSVDLAKVSIAVRLTYGRSMYFAFHKKLMGFGDGPRVRSSALTIARELGLDADKIDSVANSEPVQTELQANKLLAKALSINGTPTFVTPAGIHTGPLAELDLTPLLEKGSRP